MFNLNCLGTILPCQVFVPDMVAHNRGVVINIASMAGIRPLTRVVAYSAAKAAIANFTQWLAVHLAQQYSPHIRVNAIAPGFFLTAQNELPLAGQADAQAHRARPDDPGPHAGQSVRRPRMICWARCCGW